LRGAKRWPGLTRPSNPAPSAHPHHDCFPRLSLGVAMTAGIGFASQINDASKPGLSLGPRLRGDDAAKFPSHEGVYTGLSSGVAQPAFDVTGECVEQTARHRADLAGADRFAIDPYDGLHEAGRAGDERLTRLAHVMFAELRL
jgi:hypothetical protein